MKNTTAARTPGSCVRWLGCTTTLQSAPRGVWRAVMSAHERQPRRFIVAGRVVGGGEFRTFERLAPRVPPGFEDMFVRLDEAAFR